MQAGFGLEWENTILVALLPLLLLLLLLLLKMLLVVVVFAATTTGAATTGAAASAATKVAAARIGDARQRKCAGEERPGASEQEQEHLLRFGMLGKQSTPSNLHRRGERAGRTPTVRPGVGA